MNRILIFYTLTLVIYVIGVLRARCATAFVARQGQVMNPFGPQPDVRGAALGEVIEKILAAELELGKE